MHLRKYATIDFVRSDHMLLFTKCETERVDMDTGFGKCRLHKPLVLIIKTIVNIASVVTGWKECLMLYDEVHHFI